MFDAAALRNTLIVRMDRIGDVLLTIPMAGAVKRLAPDARVTFLVRSYTRPLLEGNPDIDQIISVEREADLTAILPALRDQHFSSVFCPSPSLPIANAMKRAGIPIRVGTAFRGYATLFTHRIAEHRKFAERHEAQFNLRMIDSAASATPVSNPSKIFLSDRVRDEATQWLRTNGIVADEEFIVVHPGSGGSAKDFPPEKFAQLVARLHEEFDGKIIFTGIETERALLQHVQQMAGVEIIECVGLPLVTLAAIIERAACLVTNSTGVLHIAAAVGTFVIGMYPPIVACSPRRWGPWTTHAAVFEPGVETPCGDCGSAGCIHFDCMRLIDIEKIMDVVRTRIGNVHV